MITASVVLVIGCFWLAIGCLMSDKLFPRLRPVERFIRSLPLGK